MEAPLANQLEQLFINKECMRGREVCAQAFLF